MKPIIVVLILSVIAVNGNAFLRDAPVCVEDQCNIENNCRCSSTRNPLGENSPQLISITVSESVVSTTFERYITPLLWDRVNPDGNPIGATFFVNHEYTDYELTQQLWTRGFEIGSHSITKNSSQEYWRNASTQDLIDEFGGMRTILNKFANIPTEDIIGVRTPQLQLHGDVSIDAYTATDFIYDNSWPTLNAQHFLPYTVDFRSTQNCLVSMECPVNSHPGFWIVPITDIKGADDVECNSLATCNVHGTADEIADWLIGEINKVRSGNRAPIVIRLDAYWFEQVKNSFEGLTLALDQLGQLSDVFLVSTKEIHEWIKSPKPLGEFSTAVYDRDAECRAVTCKLKGPDGKERNMRSCVRCPAVYPWKGNPLGV